MAYVKQTWNDGDPDTPLSAARLSHIEDGLSDAANVADSAAPASHTHAAGDVDSGTFSAARIPSLAISKVSGLQGIIDDLTARVEALEATEGE